MAVFGDRELQRLFEAGPCLRPVDVIGQDEQIASETIFRGDASYKLVSSPPGSSYVGLMRW